MVLGVMVSSIDRRWPTQQPTTLLAGWTPHVEMRRLRLIDRMEHSITQPKNNEKSRAIVEQGIGQVDWLEVNR
jgi:hypothetical protein